MLAKAITTKNILQIAKEHHNYEELARAGLRHICRHTVFMNIQISGNLSGPTAIFLAGWPDTCDVFRDNIMATLAADYRIVGITLPGFDDDHPFVKALHQKRFNSSLGGQHCENSTLNTCYTDAANNSNSNKDRRGGGCTGSWLPHLFPFSNTHADDGAAQVAAAQQNCLANMLRMACGKPPLEMFRTTWKGHSFQDLTTMLEIAVDTAMETCNYCPSVVTSIAASGGTAAGATCVSTSTTARATAATAGAAAAASTNRGDAALPRSRASAADVFDDESEEVPLHQLPPRYTRPVLIAHDWGCLLAYELLLMRPGFFSRIVALDVGAYAFESNGPHVERMCGLVSRRGNDGAASLSTSFAASPPRTPGITTSAEPERAQASSVGGGKRPPSSPSTRDSQGTSKTGPLQNSSEASRQLVGAQGVSPSSKRSDGGAAAATAQSAHRSSGNSLQEMPTSLSMMVVHGVPSEAYHDGIHKRNSGSGDISTVHFEAPKPSFTSPSQLQDRSAGAATKRSLASQYAIRRKKPTSQTQRADRWKKVAIVAYQWFLIVCELFLPHRLARWLVGCFASFIGRPTYCYDPQIVSTPTVDLLNHTLNAQYFAQHPYALENRGAFDLPVLLQMQDAANRSSRLTESSFPSINLEHPSLMHSQQPPRLLPGWKILLIPYVEGSSMPVATVGKPGNSGVHSSQDNPHLLSGKDALSPVSRRSGAHRIDSESDERPPLATATQNEQRSSHFCTRQTSSQPGRSLRPYLLHSASSTSTDFSQYDVSSPLRPAGAKEAEPPLSNETTAVPVADAGCTIYASYAKGAALFEEWNAPVEGLGRVNANAGGSGELDPYLSVLDIPNPLWAAEDPLALTGAQSFQEPRRGAWNGNEGYNLIAADSDGASRKGAATTATAAASSSSAHMQVTKQKIFYQAFAFPPLVLPTNGSSASLNGDANNTSVMNNNNDTTSSRSTHSTVLDRLRRSHRKAALRPSVPVTASPWQGWIYLRFWLGIVLMYFMAFTSWLFREKKPTPTTGSGDGGGNSGSANNNNSKTYSNVMTTAMTTIYRRLPATPSLAASTVNLPGDGDVVLEPMGYAPLVIQRYFVPLPVPILFMYGGGKKFMLHADHWCQYIRQYQRPRDGISDVVEVHGGGHWFFAEKKYQKKVADRIAEFLAAEQRGPLGV
jgi:pimeloyl-ACP methyl ester carboxylesterase